MPFLLCLLSLMMPGSEERVLAFPIDGQIKELLVKPGDRVRVGQTLAQLDDRSILKEVKTGKAQVLGEAIRLMMAEVDCLAAQGIFDRDEYLVRRGRWCGSLLELEINELRLKHTEARVQLAKVNQALAQFTLQLLERKRQRHTLTSNLAGVVIGVHTQEGALINQGTAVVTIRVMPKK